MSKYIDTAILKQSLKMHRLVVDTLSCEDNNPITNDFLYIIDSLPEVIIRCKDCKHYSCRCCHLFDGLTLPSPDDFCSYAERREEDDKR